MANIKIQFLVLHMTVGLSLQSCLDIFNKMQTNGATMDYGCVTETCQGDKWVPDKDGILSKCKRCHAFGGLHLDDFSGARFAWKDGCNYPLVQESSSMNPQFGVFMDFKQIGHFPYVGAPTTYQDDRNTKVVLYPTLLNGNSSKLFHVKVNGVERVITLSTPTLLRGPNNIETSVFAWKNSTCVSLYGKSKILVELCDKQFNIWAPSKGPLFPATLGGICGSTDSTALGERTLVARDGTKYPNPGSWASLPALNFGNSWKTNEQTKENCKTGGTRFVDIEHGNLHMAGFTVHNIVENHTEIHDRTKIHRANTIVPGKISSISRKSFTNSSLEVDWIPPPDSKSNYTSYTLKWTDSRSQIDQEHPVAAPPYTITGLAPCANYIITVTPYTSSIGEGEPSNNVSMATACLITKK